MRRFILAAGICAAACLQSAALAGSLAVNFIHSEFAENTGIDNSTENTAALNALAGVDAPTWYNFGVQGPETAAGSGTAGPLSIEWASANTWQAGSEGVTAGGDASQQPFRVYLDDGDGGTSYQSGDGYGASIEVSGLAAFLASEGQPRYTLTVLYSSDNDAVPFDVTEIREGSLDGTNAISSLPLLGLTDWQVIGDGTGPIPAGAGTSTQGTRGFGQINGLSADSVVIAGLANPPGPARTAIAGFIITPVPEPTSLAAGLCVIAIGAFMLRRR
jgi:hypothetical protein